MILRRSFLAPPLLLVAASCLAPQALAATLQYVTVGCTSTGKSCSAPTSATTQQLAATAHYSDNTTADVTAAASWSSSSSAVVSVSNAAGSQGLATYHGVAGYSEVSAVYMGLTGATNMSVTTPVSATTGSINPHDTNSNIANETDSTSYHQVVLPSATPKDVLVIFLGGSLSSTSDYTGTSSIINEAASLGFGAIALDYPNNLVIGVSCGQSDTCYTNFRGEVVYGQSVQYGPTSQSYHSLDILTSKVDSVVSRIVNLLDCLENGAAPCNVGNPVYWSQFLITTDTNSPYATLHHAHAYPNWSKIILAGHSQGGGMAGFLGMTLPTTVRRVVMLSSPQDNYTPLGGSETSASWIKASIVSTPMSNFWGMRSTGDGEGNYGDFVTSNWASMGNGTGVGAGNGTESLQSVGYDIGDGSAAGPSPLATQRLVTSQPDTTEALYQHESTADTTPQSTSNTAAFPSGRTYAWDYLLSGNGAD